LPASLRPIVEFAYITGWRIVSEVLPLEWRQVDFAAGEIRLDPGTTKNGEGRVFPFTDDLKRLLEEQRTEQESSGRAARSSRVDDQEFYQLLDTDGISDDIHLFNEKLREWEDYYNYHRPHGALSGQTPYERLLEKTRAEVLPGS